MWQKEQVLATFLSVLQEQRQHLFLQVGFSAKCWTSAGGVFPTPMMLIAARIGACSVAVSALLFMSGMSIKCTTNYFTVLSCKIELKHSIS